MTLTVDVVSPAGVESDRSSVELPAEIFDVPTNIALIHQVVVAQLAAARQGTAGVMKRHGFHGVSASHGSHRNHRKPGSIGGCATPGRVFKGLRMAGHMGAEQVTTQNLKVHAVDTDKGVILIKGAVPGPKGALVVIRSAVKGA